MNLETELDNLEMLYQNEDYEELIEKCDELLEQYPDLQNAIGYKSITLLYLGKHDEAKELLERGIELYPENYYLKNNLSMVYAELGDYRKALELCEEGLKIRRFDWLCINKFKNLIRLGMLDEAVICQRQYSDEIELPYPFLEGDMKGFELDYYCHLLKEKPDNIKIVDMIKMVAVYNSLEMPEIGGHYLEWIGCITHSECPDCGGKVIPKENGEGLHCSGCQRDFTISLENINIKCENNSLAKYAFWNVFKLTYSFEKYSKTRISLDNLKESMAALDDAEFDSFIKRLLEVGYIRKHDNDHVELTI